MNYARIKSVLSACAVWPIPVAELREYAIWGGVPRYWELRRDYPDKETAIRKVLLDPQGPLIEEPQRLLRDDMRDTVQASTLLTIIGNGANKLSEIANRAGKDSSTISEPLRSCEISAMLVERFLLVRVLRKVRREFIISMILFYVFTISLLCLIVLFWNWEEWIW